VGCRFGRLRWPTHLLQGLSGVPDKRGNVVVNKYNYYLERAKVAREYGNEDLAKSYEKLAALEVDSE